MASGASQVSAQERLLPIRLGRVQFFPSLGISAEQQDNVEKLNEDDPIVGPVNSGIRVLSPQLRFELPLARSRARLAYRGDFREYSADILKDLGGASHYLEFMGHFEVGRMMRIDVGDRYLDGITGLLNTAPGGEYRYTTQPIESNDLRLAMAFRLGPIQSIELGGSNGKSHFLNTQSSDPTATFFYDFESQSWFAHYVFDSGAGSSIYASVDNQDIRQEQELVNNEYRTRSLGVGYRRATTRDLSSEVRISYSHTDFLEGFGTPFRGLTYEGDLNAALSSGNLLQVRFRRAPQLSFFNVSAYYLNEMGEVAYMHPLGRTVILAAQVNFQYNVYSEEVHVSEPGLNGAFDYLAPSEGERRRDKIWTTALTVTWKLNRSVDLTAGYRGQKARSNIVADTLGTLYDIYSYDSHGIILATVIGWQ